MQVFGVKRDQLPDGAGPAVEQVSISTHNGTHLDAPYHFHPTMDNGKPAMTIDQVPLEWCFNDAVKLDFRDKAGRLCLHRRRHEARARPHPVHAQAARHRAGEHRGRERPTASRTSSTAAAASGARRRCSCSIRASASPAPTAGAGTRRSASRRSASPRPATPASSGRATRPGARSAIATWRSCPISTRCPTTASRSRAFR